MTNGKWLTVAGVALIAILVLMWRQLDESPAAAAPPPAPLRKAAPVPKWQPPVAEQVPPMKPPEAPAPDDGRPKKLDPRSDAFFYKHDELVIPNLSREAVKCLEGYKRPLHRNQSMVLRFKQRIRDGRVTIHDVTVDRTNLGDPALEACFIQQIRNASWHSDELPDWDQEDEIKVGPRQLKKYTRENIEYVGAPAPRTIEYVRGTPEPAEPAEPNESE